MKKMPCLFVRNFFDKRSFEITREVTKGCEWVINGEGIASIKRDGTACAVINGNLYRRYDAKAGKKPPVGAIPCDPEPDTITKHWPHWVLVDKEDSGSKYHIDALSRASLLDGTYELIGPKINGNPENFAEHSFIRHGAEVIEVPRDFDELKEFLLNFDFEGVVFSHPDGRKCKIRKDDFGYVRNSSVKKQNGEK